MQLYYIITPVRNGKKCPTPKETLEKKIFFGKIIVSSVANDVWLFAMIILFYKFAV